MEEGQQVGVVQVFEGWGFLQQILTLMGKTEQGRGKQGENHLTFRFTVSRLGIDWRSQISSMRMFFGQFCREIVLTTFFRHRYYSLFNSLDRDVASIPKRYGCALQTIL